MADLILLYLGAGLTVLWGIAHLFPTRSIVRDFGDINTDNKRIITMEWIAEGIALIFIGVLVAAVTFIDPYLHVSRAVYIISCLGLSALTIVSLLTGFKINFLPFRLCPLIFTISLILIATGGIF